MLLCSGSAELVGGFPNSLSEERAGVDSGWLLLLLVLLLLELLLLLLLMLPLPLLLLFCVGELEELEGPSTALRR